MEDKLNEILKRVEAMDKLINAFESLAKSSGEFTHVVADSIKRIQALEAKVFDRKQYGIDDKDYPTNVIELASSWMPSTTIKIPELDSDIVKVRDYNRQASIFVSTEKAESAMQEIGNAMTAFKDSLQVHEDDAINKFEADLIERFGWRDGANYMTVDKTSLAGTSIVWQWSKMPLKSEYSERWTNHGKDFKASPIGSIHLPENIDWKDCLFTRKDQSDEQ